MTRLTRKPKTPQQTAQQTRTLAALEAAIPQCQACVRLREHCQTVAQTKVRRFASDEYWGKPVSGFGDPAARVLIVGLAPAAHGANRTGRVFTGDRSGDFLYAALYRAGLASQPDSVSRDDGLTLYGAYVSAAARCAPPDNRPTPDELATCRPFLRAELSLLPKLRVVIALGAIGHQAVELALRDVAQPGDPRVPKFAHGQRSLLTLDPTRSLWLLDCYHVSQQNTFTGRLTPKMLDDVLRQAKVLAQLDAA